MSPETIYKAMKERASTATLFGGGCCMMLSLLPGSSVFAIESWGPCTAGLEWKTQRLVQGADRCLLPSLEEQLLTQADVDESYRFDLLGLNGLGFTGDTSETSYRQAAFLIVIAPQEVPAERRFAISYECLWRVDETWSCSEWGRDKVVYFRGRPVLTRSDEAEALRALRSLRQTPAQEFHESLHWRYRKDLTGYYRQLWNRGRGHQDYRPTFPEISIQAKVNLWGSLLHLINPKVYSVSVFNDDLFVYSLGDWQCSFPHITARASNCDAERCDLSLELKDLGGAC